MGEYAEVIAKLRRVAASDLSDVDDRMHGLCSQIICAQIIGRNDSELQHRCNAIFTTWEHYSGDRAYPVPSTTTPNTPATQYADTNNLYDKRTKYGRLRMNLAGYVADELERLYGK